MKITNYLILLLCAVSHAALAQMTPLAMPKTLSWNEVEKLPLPAAAEKIAYGSAPQQFGELRVPQGKGPFPVVVLIHGGCWLADFNYVHITRLAALMVQQGAAVWTIEYRRLGDADGGWPNTLLDAGHAADYLRVLAKKHPLDLQRVISIGHSAGGQLALWLAARDKLPADSELHLKDPLKLKAIIGLAAITDLETYRIGPPDSCNASVDQLLGGTPEKYPLRYAQTSPLALLPLGVPQWLIQGELDLIVPATSTGAYHQAAMAAGDVMSLTALPNTGHFEMVAPQAPVWPVLQTALRQALNLPPLRR